MNKYYGRMRLVDIIMYKTFVLFGASSETDKELEKSNNFLSKTNNFWVQANFNELRHMIRRKIIVSKNEYKEAINYYNFIVENAALLIKSLKLNKSPFADYIIASSLINDGKLSYKGQLYLTDEKELIKDVPGFLGLDVVRGVGCCRHTAQMLEDIMTELGNDVRDLSLAQEKDGIPYHAVALLNNNGNYVGLESLSNALYFIKRDGKLIDARNYYEKSPMNMGYIRVARNYYFDDFDNLNELKKFFNQVTKEDKRREKDTILEYVDSYWTVCENAKYNDPLIRDFAEGVKPVIYKTKQLLK